MSRTLESLPASRRSQPCELCREVDFRVLAELDRRGQRLVTVLCGRCGLVSHESLPTDEELDHYYRRRYRQDYHGEFTPSAYRVLREWERGGELVELLRNRVSAGGSVFEIGAGIGCTLKQFERAGYRTSGIEPGEGFCAFSHRTLGCDVRQAVWQDLPPGPAHDLVLLVHVLEHFASPRNALVRAGQLLRPGGRVYVEVPNLEAPHASPKRLFHYAHIHNFTAATLTLLGEQAGLELDQLFSGPGDKNLRMLLRRSTVSQPVISLAASRERYAAGVQSSLDGYFRYGTLAYHARWSYLAQRLGTVVRHRLDRWRSERRLERILAEFQANSPQSSASRRVA